VHVHVLEQNVVYNVYSLQFTTSKIVRCPQLYIDMWVSVCIGISKHDQTHFHREIVLHLKPVFCIPSHCNVQSFRNKVKHT